MRDTTRVMFNKMKADICLTYGIESVSDSFSATPTVQQILVDKMVESIAFLQQINVVTVPEMEGQKVIGSVSPITGKRTDTIAGDRQTSDPLNLGTKDYKCYFTEYDVHILYSTIDAWAKLNNLPTKFMDYVRLAIGHSKIRTGWRGTHAAAVTNSTTYPLGEDTNIGWNQILRNYNGGSQMLSVGKADGKIRIGAGAGADYPNLDAFAHDVKQLINPLHRESGDLVAIIGDDLTSQDKAQLYVAQGQTPSEKERIELATVNRTYAGLLSYQIPYFPSRGLMITSFDNLSIYQQEGKVRQHIIENPKRSRIEHFNSTNEAYVVEDEEKAASVEFDNVQFWDGAAWV